MRKRVTIAVTGALVIVLVVAGFLWWRGTPGTEFERAATLAPADSERLSWTDWSAVRDELGARLTADSSAQDVSDFLDRGYDADLTSASALLQSAPEMQTSFGFSPATAEWELFSQSARGAVVMLRLTDSVDFAALEDRLVDLGYTRPADDTGVWLGGPDLLSTIGSGLTPELQYVALDADDQLLLTSDTEEFLAQAVDDAAAGDGVADELRTVVAASGEAVSASAYTGSYTCSALAMSQADPANQAEADALLRAAGKVNPVTGFAMSVQPDLGVRVVMSFENDDQARTNADTRAALVSGPAPGQGGDFTDRFTVGQVVADGRLVRMDLEPKEGQYVLSDLSTGPVLFATC